MLRTSPSAESYVVDTAPGSVHLEPRGEYDLGVTSRGPDLELSVVRGVAALEARGERLVVRGGETLVANDAGQRDLRRFNSARFDAFTAWAYERASGSALGASSRYLPSELRPYGRYLDQHGRWDHVASYGYVWYPSVALGWRPYSRGGWRHTRYGWTWYGHDPWAWPTHHFGRWGFSGSAWFWVPGKIWGPAWVSWGFAPGYIGWCPIGWERPYGVWARRGYDPWHSWTAIPRRHFGYRGPVQPWIVPARTLPEASRRAFVHPSAPPPSPAGRGYAVPRGSLAVAGSSGPQRSPAAPADIQPRAVPRQAVPRGSWSAPGTPQSPNSWSRLPAGASAMAGPTSGAVRRPPAETPTTPSTTPQVGNTTPVIRGSAPTVTPGTGDSPGDARYAIPRRPLDGRYRQEDADVFRGRIRSPEANAPAGNQSWTPRGRPNGDSGAAVRRGDEAGNRGGDPGPRPPSSYDRGGRSGAVRDPGRAGRAGGGEGQASAPPARSGSARGGDNGGGASRGAVRRPR